ncbi:MAG: response regulator transcription factor [Rhodothermales bacterium]
MEDDVDVQQALASYLEFEGYETTAIGDGDEALHILRNGTKFDLILLDVMLPSRNGFDVLREARGMGIRTPVVMLTAKDQQDDILRGFALGADDYVPKPFSADVLRSRIRAILSRSKAPAEQPMDVHTIGDLSVNFTSNEAARVDEPIEFTALEFNLLRYLITNRGRVVSRGQLLREVWKLPETVDTRTVDRHVASIRKKIEPDRSEPRHIHTVYGRGYRFEL